LKARIMLVPGAAGPGLCPAIQPDTDRAVNAKKIKFEWRN
jgi:hypothetical protein